AIRDRVVAGTMPPWHADPAYGQFANDRRLTDADRDTIVRWVDSGAPEGDPGDLPAAPRYTDGWQIGQPDAVLTMNEDYSVPAGGTVEYKYFQVQTNFTEDKWIRAIESRPGNRTVVHHVIAFARDPKPAAKPAANAKPAPKPTPTFMFAEGMDEPENPESQAQINAPPHIPP